MEETLKQFQAQMEGMFKGVLEKQIPELVKSQIDEVMNARKGFALAGKSADEIEKMDMKSKALAFIKAVSTGDMDTLVAMKALGTNSDPDGGFLVPEAWASEISRIASDVGLLRKLGRSMTLEMSTNMPKAGSAVSVYWPGENNAATPSNPSFGSVKMELHECVGMSVMSNQILTRSGADLIDYLTTLFVEALVAEEDKQAFVGTGAPFTGILRHPDSATRLLASGSSFSSVTPADLLNMQGDVSTGARRGGAYFMSFSVWLIVRQLLQASQYLTSFANPTLQSFGDVLQPLAPVGAIDGRPVYITDELPEASASASATPFIVFGNLKYVNLGLSPRMSVDISKEATVDGTSTFQNNQSAFRIIQEKAIAVMHGNAFSVLKTN